MRKGMILVGALGVALVVFGAGIALSRRPVPERWVRTVETLGKDPRLRAAQHGKGSRHDEA